MRQSLQNNHKDKIMKHVGKMKNNGARVAVVFRTLPGDPYSCLVVGTNGLTDSYHDSLMSLIENESTQQANELADVLAVRKFPDGSNMLEWMHTYGHLKKVPTNIVLMTFDPKNQIQLDELNLLIADQKGVALEDLAISDSAADKKESQQPKTKWDKAREEKAASKEEVEVKATASVDLTPSEMRSRADALYKEAARLRKEADTIDPPKKKAKETTEA
jgi:hypothetical protein